MSTNMTEEPSQVGQKPSPDWQMSDAAYIDQAAHWAKELTRMKSRGPGDLDNAMRRVEREHEIDYSVLYTLRYRRNRLKDIGVSIYMRLQAAYRAECERQMRKLKHELEITKAVAGAGDASVVAAQALVDEANSQEG
jgi:hypothetical protein